MKTFERDSSGNWENKPKKSAADIEALRWREMFTQFGAALIIKGDLDYKNALVRAASAADYGMTLFHTRYTKEK